MRYVVRTGEDINSISDRFRADPNEVASLNLIEGNLQAGDIIEIPSGMNQPVGPPGYAVGGPVGQRPMGQPQVPGPKKPKKPPIFGQPMPDAGIKKPTMGQIKQPPQRLSPKNYAQEEQAKKRLRGMGGGRPGMMRPGQRPGGGPQQGQRGAGGTAMLDQLWSSIAPQKRGFAEGGPVPNQPQDMSKYQDIYGKKMAELRSSGEASQQGAPQRGIAGIPQGGRRGPARPQMGGPQMGGSPMGGPPTGGPPMGGRPMGQSMGKPPMGPKRGGPPPGGRMPKSPMGGGIASVAQGKKSPTSAMEDSAKSVKAGIMAAASIPRSRSGISQILSA
jgi:hypothetical protein